MLVKFNLNDKSIIRQEDRIDVDKKVYKEGH